MADKDKKLRVILKLPNKSNSNTKSGVTNIPASSGVTPHKLRISQVTGTYTSLKLAGQASASSANDHVGTPPKKRKFKTLVEGDAKDDHGGVYGSPSTTGIGSPVFKAPLPPLAKKPSHKKKEKAINGVDEPFLASPGKGQVATASPGKKVLEGVLDKLKKKDTYGVFSEPVDAKLVPDYYDVIKEPMDFGTMYKKIAKGSYYTKSLFEKDIMLICNNAMRYNGPETIYYKQARSIQEAARKALDLLPSQSGALEAVSTKPASHKKQSHPPKKGWKNTAAVKTLLEPANSDFASGASLAAEEDDLPLSNKPDTFGSKKGAPSDRSGSVAVDEPGWGVQSQATAGPEPDADVLDDQGVQLKPTTLKDGRKPLSTDEYHRSSYKPRNLPAHGRGAPLAGVGGELHHLVPTGYQSEMAYAKSLSRFSAKLGPEGWKHAAQRLQRVLAPSVPFGQGWVGEQEAPPGTIFKKYPSDASVSSPTRIDQNIASTSLRSLPGVTSTSLPPVPTASFIPTPNISRSLTESSNEKISKSEYQVEFGRNRSMPVTSDRPSTSTGWSICSSLASANQSGVPTSGMIMQTSSDSVNGSLSGWTGSTSQAAPTFVYSTAVRAVPTSVSMNIGQIDASKAQAHNLGLLQADAIARAKMQSNVHLTRAPRPTQFVQPPMYNSIPPYGVQPGSMVRIPYGANQMLSSSQPLSSPTVPNQALKLATSQPPQPQVGAIANYGLPYGRSVLNSIHSSRPSPDTSTQSAESLSTQISGQLTAMGAPQTSLPLHMG